MDSTERYSCVAAGKARHTPKIQTSISYEHIERDAIVSSRQEAATNRSRHSRSTSLPKIATGRSAHSAKKLWQDYETIEVKAKVQRENEKTPEVPPLRVPKNPHSLYKHTVRNVKPYHILHSPSDYGRANHQLRQLYAQVTYLSNAVRNCDGTASYKGMCKSRQSYRGDGDNPLRLHWVSSNDKKPVPRLLLPVMPGTNTKWYSWKVDTPREEGSPRGGGVVRGSDKRYASSAPVSRSLDFIERYRKKHRVVFSIDDDGGRRSKNSKEMDSKSKDGHLSVKSIEGTESLASTSLSSIIKYDANKFKLSDNESVTGTAVFLTQPKTASPEVQRKQADVSAGSHLGNEETNKTEDAATDQDEKRTSEGENVSSAKEEAVVETQVSQTEAIKAAPESSPEDELDIVARANEVADTQGDQVSDKLQEASNAVRDTTTSQNPQQDDSVSQQQDQVSDEPQQESNAVTDTTTSQNPPQGDSVSQQRDQVSDKPQQESIAVTDTTTQQQDVDMATDVQSEAPIAEDQRIDVEVTSDKEGILQSQDGDPITIDSGTGNPKNDSFGNQQIVQSNDDNLASTQAKLENTAILSNSDNEQYNTPNSGNGSSEVEQHPSEDDQPHGVHVPLTEGSLNAHEVDEVHEDIQVYEANEQTQEDDTTYTSQDT